MSNVFVGHGFYGTAPSKEGIPFYVVAQNIQKALKIINEIDRQLDVSSIDQFDDYVPVISHEITPENCKTIELSGFLIRTRTDVFAEFMYSNEQVDKVYRAFFVIAKDSTNALSELTRFLTDKNLIKDTTFIGMDKVLSENRIFIDYQCLSN